MPLLSGYTGPQSNEERLGQLDELLDEWRVYINEAPSVLDGSSLAADDELFPVFTPSSLAWHGICSATHHLDMFMAPLREGISHPLAPSTIARAGMVSGAHALWLLDGPTRIERQKRGLQLAHEEFFRDHQATSDIAKIREPESSDDDMNTYLNTRAEWMRRAIAVGGQIGMNPKEVRTFNDTRLLDEVARRLAERDPEGADLIHAVRVVWRTYSGVAHGLRWPVMYRATFGEPTPGGSPGTVHGQVANSTDDLTMAACAVGIFLLNAVELFERRRTQPG